MSSTSVTRNANGVQKKNITHSILHTICMHKKLESENTILVSIDQLLDFHIVTK